ncbi:uncharacterized protein LOC116604102 [Nematostella vectensis]|uniref:uncharacterized protein LOC116604102 n=1 Tax=Nematostella vectensis TaxID=45351 RepID=UPI00207733F9|nr:uncharacterized protein LOC116604102 [Nematostella vectensis]
MSFRAGNIANFFDAWRELTSDATILDMVKGCHIEFGTEPVQHNLPNSFANQSQLEKDIIETEISKLIQKGVIQKATPCKEQFISSVFTRPKKDGSFRMILNLNQFNAFITYHHFKMESLQSALTLVKPGSFMAVLDLKDAYYSVSIAEEHRCYLRYVFMEQLYEYVSLPNGLASAPRMFTKLMRPVYSSLRADICFVGYIDDIIILADSPEELRTALKETRDLLTSLGFFIHESKSSVTPSEEVKFLGTVASVIGLKVSSFPGVRYGPLFYSQLENEKTVELKHNGYNLDAKMELSTLAKEDLKWWIENVELSPVPILVPPANVILKCDSSLLGWGSVIDGSNNVTGGRWSPDEALFHINFLELKAIKLGLQSLCSHMCNTHIKVLFDNQTAVAYIRAMGGTHSDLCNQMTREILLWCKQRNLWLTSSHLPGHLNVTADKASREFKDNTEWSLDISAFNMLVAQWGQPCVDIFSSRLNNKVQKYVSWKPDPTAFAIDAFTIDWAQYDLIYCFPPFNLIGKVLQKIQACRCTALLVAPLWKTQLWYPKLLKMLMKSPIPIPMTRKTLALPRRPSTSSPYVSQPKTDWLSSVSEMLRGKGIDGEPLEIILGSWRDGTKKAIYNLH